MNPPTNEKPIRKYHVSSKKNLPDKYIGKFVLAAINDLKMDRPTIEDIHCYLSKNLGVDVESHADAIQSFFDSAVKSKLTTDVDSCVKTVARRRKSKSPRRKTSPRKKTSGKKRRSSGKSKTARRPRSGQKKSRRRRKVDSDVE